MAPGGSGGGPQRLAVGKHPLHGQPDRPGRHLPGRDVPAWINRTLDVTRIPGSGRPADSPSAHLRHADGDPASRTSTARRWPFPASRNPPSPRSGRRPSRPPSAATPKPSTGRHRCGHAEHRFEGHAIYFAAGERDPEFIGYMDVLSDAARAAGFTVEARPVADAGHSWEAASSGLPAGLDFLAPLGHPAVSPAAPAAGGGGGPAARGPPLPGPGEGLRQSLGASPRHSLHPGGPRGLPGHRRGHRKLPRPGRRNRCWTWRPSAPPG